MSYLALLIRWACQNQGLDYYLDYLLELQETEPERTFVLSLVGMSPDETHQILKQ